MEDSDDDGETSEKEEELRWLVLDWMVNEIRAGRAGRAADVDWERSDQPIIFKLFFLCIDGMAPRH